jgi:hypothetical protein
LSGLGIGELEASVASVSGGSSDRSTIPSSVHEFILEVEMNVRCGGGRSRLRSLLVPITIIAIIAIIIVIVVSIIAIISIVVVVVVVISTTSVTSTWVTDDRVQLLSIRDLTLRMSRARARWGG